MIWIKLWIVERTYGNLLGSVGSPLCAMFTAFLFWNIMVLCLLCGDLIKLYLISELL